MNKGIEFFKVKSSAEKMIILNVLSRWDLILIYF
jgi:hypothetical protein